MGKTIPAHRDEFGNWGPAMLALPNDGWREFVFHLVRANPKRGSQVAAARAAGYVKNSTPLNAARFAHKLSRDERVIAAITEESKKILRVAFPEGANALINLVRNPEHRDHGRAIALLLERTMPAETRHHVEVVHKMVDPDQEALEELHALRKLGTARDKLIELFGYNGLDRIERLEATDKLRRASEAKVIEHDVAEAAREQVIEQPIAKTVEQQRERVRKAMKKSRAKRPPRGGPSTRQGTSLDSPEIAEQIATEEPALKPEPITEPVVEDIVEDIVDIKPDPDDDDITLEIVPEDDF